MKKILATMLLGLALGVAALPVSAQGVDGAVTMTAQNDGAAVSLSLPQEEARGITALRLSFAVEGDEIHNATFQFAEGLDSSVKRARYDADSGRLHVYLAGRTELLPDGQAALGQIQLDAPEGSTVSLQVVEDSLQLVNGSFSQTADVTTSGEAVSVTVGGENQKPETTTPPSSGNGSSGSNGSQQGTQNTQTAAGTPTPTPAVDQQSTQVVDTVVLYNGQSNTGSTGTGGNKTPSGTQTGAETESDSQTPVQTMEPAASEEQPAATAAPDDETDAATPEQTATDTTHNLPLTAALVVAVLAILVLIGVGVLRLRNR